MPKPIASAQDYELRRAFGKVVALLQRILSELQAHGPFTWNICWVRCTYLPTRAEAAESRCRCGRSEPSAGADVGGSSYAGGASRAASCPRTRVPLRARRAATTTPPPVGRAGCCGAPTVMWHVVCCIVHGTRATAGVVDTKSLGG